ncbi:3-mercaptopyruvate sulfurtransferase [Aquabacter spiritensis]|uniref:Thiosulfate/3-mercaptopyruvate sulfurtransferase n=1 Tax=Aquabacter spiritensis TaxID=933073 RepID=A0A4R3LPW2_9HYPH|nr:3-mercaptopyruvate sulfurtransferase [Aquabacter spiritensis]TCT02442.1 thiosulfate/3-mercaptopyruvate sulfurtransferase [Aquabacter spiritensis]
MSIFVTTEWLADNLSAPDLVIVDGSWHLPPTGRTGGPEFLERHIPGAVFFDLEAVSDTTSDLPHMLPEPRAFATAVGALGIGDGVRIVVYDSLGLFSAPRVWWTFRAFGAQDVKILEGGLPKWLAEDRPVESGAARRLPGVFNARLDRSVVADIGHIERVVASGGPTQILDARAAGRFAGTAPEPRPNLPSGRIPGSLNLPSSTLVKDGVLASPEVVRQELDAAGVDLSRPIITSCGSGVSAAILWIALESVGKRPTALYDGSWTEWASRGKPIETDAA